MAVQGEEVASQHLHFWKNIIKSAELIYELRTMNLRAKQKTSESSEDILDLFFFLGTNAYITCSS